MATVQQGQKAENLLDFDADEPAPANSGFMGSSGMASMISPTPTGSTVPTTNPLDELMDLFSSTGMTAPTSNPTPAFPSTSSVPVAAAAEAPKPHQQQQQQAPQAQSQGSAQDDLLGLF